MGNKQSYKLIKIMSIDDLDKLRLNQQVRVKCKEPIDGYFIATIKSINDWKKLVGVVDIHDRYKEYPPRLILNDL